VQRGLGLRDLDLGGREPSALCSLDEPPGEEHPARAVLAAHGLELRSPARDGVELAVDRHFEPPEPDGEHVKTALRDGAASQRVDDVAPAPAADLNPGL